MINDEGSSLFLNHRFSACFIREVKIRFKNYNLNIICPFFFFFFRKKLFFAEEHIKIKPNIGTKCILFEMWERSLHRITYKPIF